MISDRDREYCKVLTDRLEKEVSVTLTAEEWCEIIHAVQKRIRECDALDITTSHNPKSTLKTAAEKIRKELKKSG